MKKLPLQPPADAPTGTQWFGGPIGWFDVSLRVRSDALDPANITALFGVSADCSQTRGVPLLRADGSVQRVPTFGSWGVTLAPEQTDEWDVVEACRLLLQRLPADKNIWLAVASHAPILLSVALSLESANQGFSLEPEFCQFLAERKIRLDMHVYAGDKLKGRTP